MSQMGSNEAHYNFNSIVNTLQGSGANALDPYHTVYLLADDATHGFVAREPAVRRELEKYITRQTTIESMGTKRDYVLCLVTPALFVSINV